MAHQNPYLMGNTTVCPSQFTNRGWVACAGNGVCLPSGQCSCLALFRGPGCTYPLRSRRTAFILSFLLGTWGAGSLYLGLIGTGVMQLLIFTLLLSLPCFPLCCMCVTSDAGKLKRFYRVIVISSVMGMIGVLVLWTADWLYILLGAADAYDYPLQDKLLSFSSKAFLTKSNTMY